MYEYRVPYACRGGHQRERIGNEEVVRPADAPAQGVGISSINQSKILTDDSNLTGDTSTHAQGTDLGGG